MELDKEYFLAGQTLLFDKDLDWTSFDLVKKVRNLMRIKKVGHAGTLDPLATGLLIVCTGKNTKKIQYIQDEEKEYIGHITLGGVTPSYDKETEVSERFSLEGLTEEGIKEAASSFVGWIDQTPPIFSAVKINGKRAYEHARKGEDVKLKSRRVEIKEFEITEVNLPEVTFKVKCSKGTYIRSLANDLGLKLNNGAYLSSLRRTKIGEYSVDDAMSVKQFEERLKGG